MLFTIASALNDPFGFDLTDIKLNRISAQNAIDLLKIHIDATMQPSYIVDTDHETPKWLELTDLYTTPRDHDESPNIVSSDRVPSIFKHLLSILSSVIHLVKARPGVTTAPSRTVDTEQPTPEKSNLDADTPQHGNEQSPKGGSGDKNLPTVNRAPSILASITEPRTLLPLVAFLAWCVFIVFLTWGVSRHDPKGETVRWWDIYIPLDSSTAQYVSLGVFLLLGFWLSDAYSRYWRALEIWQAEIPPIVDDICIYFGVTFAQGLWHARDHERFFSHLAAIPYVAKQTLRGSENISELTEILSPKDVLRVTAAHNPVEYVFEVLKGYLYSADSKIDLKVDPGKPPSILNFLPLTINVREYERLMFECRLLQTVPIPSAFTSHLYLFTVFWLALLPLTLVIHDGFVSFLYLVPVGYSIIRLISIGNDMSDPFGHDTHDLPLDVFCEDLKQKVHTAYRDTREGIKGFVKDTGYNRSNFDPVLLDETTDGNAKVSENDAVVQTGPTILKSLRKLSNVLPSVSPLPVLVYLLWTISVVFLSRKLSYRWPEELRNNCSKWCSPIDVKGSVLANIGFALFMILGFRASDATNRYENGASLLNSLRLYTRALTQDFMMYYETGEFHGGDKERLLAFLVQIPLCIRDMILGGKHRADGKKDNLLNDVDFNQYVNSASPIEYVFQTLLTHIATPNVLHKERYMLSGRPGPMDHPSVTVSFHVQNLRKNLAKIQLVTRFPVIRSYTSHQRIFTALWLMLLPLSMTTEIGYFTILWAPMISYGIICLESITVQLVNPFGTDAIDLPVHDICTQTATEILTTARSLNWDTTLVHTSAVDTSPDILDEINCDKVTLKHRRLHIKDESHKDNPLPRLLQDMDSAHVQQPKPTLYAHVLQSVPWSALLAVSCWTTLGCVISYLSRDRDVDDVVPWWQPSFLVNTNVGTYISFSVFILLGFYVNEAFSRYNAAGDIWEHTLRKGCHIVTTYALSAFPANIVHKGDHDRLVGHIAVLPIVLKAELRDQRDIREACALLSYADIGRIQCAPSMTMHCIDVILSYWNMYTRRGLKPQHVMNQTGPRMALIRFELLQIEAAINKAVTMKQFPIAPGFVTVLHILLALFFIVLQFILAPISGWLTIIWVTLIAYGILGMYKVAGELQNPFGSDLNDLDLDSIAHQIVREVIIVFHQQRAGCKALMKEPETTPQYWVQKPVVDTNEERNVFNEYDSLSKWDRFVYRLRLAMVAVSPVLIATYAVWTALAVTVAYFISEHLPQNGGNDWCGLWFCSAVAIDSSVMSYIGYSLFLLLGFFLNDSHWRFVQGLQLWRVDMKFSSQILANRWFQGFYNGFFHRGDLQRVAGHLAAASISLKDTLRDEFDNDRLIQVLSPADIERLAQSPNKVEHCFDVLRAYQMDYESVSPDPSSRRPVHGLENLYLSLYSWRHSVAPSICRRIMVIRLPFGYVTHVRIFLGIWLLLLPFGMVESAGWVSILWVTIIGYGVIGVERWAERLSDPFGHDSTDVPLDAMVDDVMETVRSNLHMFEKGVEPYIQRDRVARDAETTNMTGAVADGDDTAV